MTFGNASAIFQQAMLSPIAAKMSGATAATGATSWGSDTIKCALYGNSGTPDKTAAVGLTGYNAATSAWVTADEISGTGYTAGGATLSGKSAAIDSGSSSLCFTAGNPSWTSATLSNVYGDLVYDSSISGGTVANQGMCFNAFGGAQSVTGGTFTIQWATPSGAAVTAVFNISV